MMRLTFLLAIYVENLFYIELLNPMLKAYKYRLYPTEQQALKINRNIGCVRFVYNWALSTKMETWVTHQENLSQYDLSAKLTQLKREDKTRWLRQSDSQSLQQALVDLDVAYTKFFREKKGFPKFKKKHGNKQSFRCTQSLDIDWDTSRLFIPKFKQGIKLAVDRQFDGKIKSVTISKTKTNEYYTSVLVEILEQPIQPKAIKEKTTLGIDVGISSYLTLSTGTKISNPRHYSKYEKQLKKAAKQHARKQNGSKNREKARIKLAKIHQRIARNRHDFLHKLTYQLTHENQVQTLILEDLNVAGMMKNHNLANAISDCSWSTFLQYLTYKCEWYGINLLKIGRFEPSSKLCNECGVINQNLTLADRTWKCVCGTVHDRDVNAAINIKKIGLLVENKIGEAANSNKIGQGLSESTLRESARSQETRGTKKRRVYTPLTRKSKA